MRSLRTFGLLAAIVIQLLGCKSPEVTARPETGPRPIVQPTLDLSSAMRQAHFAFRATDGGFEGGHSTYSVDVRAGTLAVTPSHFAPGTDGAATQGSPIRFGPTRITHGGKALSLSDSGATTDERGRLETAQDGVLERLENTEAGVEQSWALSARPPGRGALEFRVPVELGRFVGADDQGLHFTGGALGVVYGHATWIDAKGARRALQARWEQRHIVLRVPAEWVEHSTYPVVLDPVIGPELAIGVPVGVPLLLEQREPAIAFNGTNFVVVWTDHWRGSQRLLVAHVGVVGGVSTAMLQGVQGRFRPGSPSIAWDGTSFHLVWEDHRDGGANVYGIRLNAQGYQDLPESPITTAPGDQTRPRVASDGTSQWVVWEDTRNGSAHIFGVRVDAAGARLDPVDLDISGNLGEQRAPTLSAGSPDFLVTWEAAPADGGPSDIVGARVSPSGNVLDTAGLPISTESGPQRRPTSSWNGSSWLVAWEDGRNASSGTEIRGAHVTATGAVEESSGLSIGGSAAGQTAPVVAWNGSQHLVAWEQARDGGTGLSAALVAADAGVLPGPPVDVAPGSPLAREPVVAWGGGVSLLAWQAGRTDGGGTEIRVGRVNSSLAALDAAGAVFEGDRFVQHESAIASDGTNYLVVWTEYRPRGIYIVAARVSPDGVLLDPQGIVLATPPFTQGQPAVAWGGGVYLVGWVQWDNGDHLTLARIAADGQVLDPQGIAVGPFVISWLQQPTIASNGTDFLVAWKAFESTTTERRVARVSAAGVVLDPTTKPIFTGRAAPYDTAMDVAWGDGVYVVVTHDCTPTCGTWGTRVTSAGTLLEPAGVLLGPDSDIPMIQQIDGGLLLVANTYGAGPVFSGWNIATSPTLTATPAFTWDAGSASKWYPSLASDGRSTLMVWRDARNAVSGGTYDLYGALLGSGAPDFHIAHAEYERWTPEVASSGPRRFMVSYGRVSPLMGWTDARLFVTPIVLNTAPVADDQSVTTDEETPVALSLTGSDADGDPLTTWRITEQPRHGALSGTPPTLLYTPAADFFGTDTVRFTVNDTFEASAAGTVTLTVANVNDAPTAEDDQVTTPEETPVSVHARANDVDGDVLTYTVVNPAHGTVAGTWPDVVYTPAEDFHGRDVVTFSVRDAAATSRTATIEITVTPVNDAPVASGLTVTTPYETAVAARLLASDVDGDPLSYVLVTQPVRGALSGSTPELVYQPAPGFSGTDTFSFLANDGTADSATATVTITVGPPPPPTDAGAHQLPSVSTPIGPMAPLGCGCSTPVEGAVPLVWLVLMALAARRTSRRRR